MTVPDPVPRLPQLDPRSSSLTEQVVVAVREAVRDGRLEPGRLYSAYQLAAELGVSRSPVREGLLRLAELGTVRFERNRGFRVVRPDPRELAEVFALRMTIEVPAVRRATAVVDDALAGALRAELAAMGSTAAAGDAGAAMAHDQRLHALMLGAAGNRRAAAVVEALREVTRQLGASTAGRSRTLADIHAEHEPVVDAICAGDADAAAGAMAAHLTRTGRLLVAQAVAEQGGDIDGDALWDEVVG